MFILFLLFGSFCSKDEKELTNRYAIGTGFYDERKLSEAILNFNKVYREDPDYKSTRFMLGKCYFYSKDLKKAKDYFGEDFDKDASRLNSGIWWYRTRLMLGEDPKEILSGIDSILDRDPEKSEAWILKGLILERLGKFPEAAQSYIKAADEFDRIAFANYRLSKVFERIGIEARSEEYLAKAKALGFGLKSKKFKSESVE